MGSAIDKLDYNSVAIDYYICDLDLSIGEPASPAFIVHSIALRPNLAIASWDLFELAVVRNNSNTAFGITHIPRFVELPNDLFCRMHFQVPLRVCMRRVSIGVGLSTTRSKMGPKRSLKVPRHGQVG